MGFVVGNTFSSWCFTSNIGWSRRGTNWLAWLQNEFQAYILEVSLQYIHRYARYMSSMCFHLTLVYGPDDDEERLSLWDNFARYGSRRAEPSVVFGDFNNITITNERVGGNVPTEANIKPFVHCAMDCG